MSLYGDRQDKDARSVFEGLHWFRPWEGEFIQGVSCIFICLEADS